MIYLFILTVILIRTAFYFALRDALPFLSCRSSACPSVILSVPSVILSVPSVILSGAKDLQHRKVSQQYIDQGCFVLLNMAVNRQSLTMTSVNGYVIPINYYQVVFEMRVLRYGYVIDLSADLKKDSSDFSFS